MKTVFQVLETLRSSNIEVAPFTNYDAANQTEYNENGTYFKSDKNMWPIHKVEYSGQGNLNITFKIPGKMVEATGAEHPCFECRTITIVKNGELKQQFLQLTKNKEAQATLPFAVKNNILDLGKFLLTTAETVNIDDVFKARVNKFAKDLFKTKKPAAQLTAEQVRLCALGLRPDGYYCKPVAKQTTVEANDDVKVSLVGLCNKTTKSAKALKEALTNVQIPDSNYNELVYQMKCLHVHCSKACTTKIGNQTITGTVIAQPCSLTPFRRA